MNNDEKLQKLIAGAIFDFAGYLTTRDNDIPVGSHSDAAPMVKLIQDWAKIRNLNTTEAAVLSWNEALDGMENGS